MKKIVFIVFLFLSQSLFSQNSIKITTKKCIPKNGIHLQLKSVQNDSRCPQRVDCIWAGEITTTIEVYKNKKVVEEKTLIINSKNRDENAKWLSDIYDKKVKSIIVNPKKVEGKSIKPSKYFIEIIFEN